VSRVSPAHRGVPSGERWPKQPAPNMLMSRPKTRMPPASLETSNAPPVSPAPLVLPPPPRRYSAPLPPTPPPVSLAPPMLPPPAPPPLRRYSAPLPGSGSRMPPASLEIFDAPPVSPAPPVLPPLPPRRYSARLPRLGSTVPVQRSIVRKSSAVVAWFACERVSACT